jgi:Peptidase family M20/M25/M40
MRLCHATHQVELAQGTQSSSLTVDGTMTDPNQRNGASDACSMDSTPYKIDYKSDYLSLDDQTAAVADFAAYLRFETVSATGPSSGAYRACGDWLVKKWRSILSIESETDASSDAVYILPESPDHSPVVVVYIEGKDPSLPVLLLNSHYDVVPAKNEDWQDDFPPFAGKICSRTSRLYGRGTQDMKSVGMQYMQAMAYLRRMHYKPQRSIYLTHVPDEGESERGVERYRLGCALLCRCDSYLLLFCVLVSAARATLLILYQVYCECCTHSFHIHYSEEIIDQ